MLRNCFKTIFRATSVCFQKIVVKQFLKKKPAIARIFLLLVAGSFYSCNPDTPEKPGPPPAYFDVQEYLKNQINYLNQTKPTVQKTVTNGILPPETETVKQVNWQQELAFFLEADINKNAWRSTYSGDTLVNEATGARTMNYRNAGEANAPVKLLQVETTAGNRVKNIYLETRQHNALFFAGRFLKISCDTTSNQNRIAAYQVSGVQKPVFADSLHYSVRAKILY